MLGIFSLLCFLVDPGDQDVKASQRAHNIVQVVLNSILVPHVKGEELGPRCPMSSIASSSLYPAVFCLEAMNVMEFMILLASSLRVVEAPPIP